MEKGWLSHSVLSCSRYQFHANDLDYFLAQFKEALIFVETTRKQAGRGKDISLKRKIPL